MADTLAVGFPMVGSCYSAFFRAIVEDFDLPSDVPRHCEIGSIVQDARNKLVRWFLKETTAQRLVMLDQDHRLPRNLLERIANYEEPVTGALYYGRHEPFPPIALVPNPRWQDPDGDGTPINLWNRETMWQGQWPAGGLVPLWPSLEQEWREEGKLNPVLVVGGGCLSVRREVLEDWPDSIPWFNFGYLPESGDLIGEDVWFCRQVWRHGYAVFLDSGVKIPHMVVKETDERDFWGRLQRKAMELGITA